MRRQILPYEPHLVKLAKQLRKNMTLSEVVLWNELKNGKMMNYDFDRQKPIGSFIVDFYCKDLFLAIEVDGSTHFEKEVLQNDLKRQKELERLQVSFLRFNALVIIENVQIAVDVIQKWIVNYEAIHGR